MYHLEAETLLFTAVAFIASSQIPAGSAYAQETATYADVLHVEEIKESIETTREECEEIASDKPPKKSNKKAVGAIVGAVAGGVIGHQIGGGKGKKLATVAGATAGGVAGNKVAGKGESAPQTERKCSVVTGPVDTVVGYNVTYKIGDKADTVRTKVKPGDRIPVKDGKLVIKQ